MKKDHVRLGRGNNSSLTPNKGISFFKPIIAGSLAIALGINVASADIPQIQSDDQKISFNSNVWNAQNNGIYQHTGNIVFAFVPSDIGGLHSTTTPIQTPNGSIDTLNKSWVWEELNGYLIQQHGKAGTVLGLTSNSSIKLIADGNNQGANQAGTLYFDFIQLVQPTDSSVSEEVGATVSKDPNWGTQDKQVRKMILNLSQASQGNYSFEGNLVVSGGRAQQMYGENVFEATFYNGMKGDLTIQENLANRNYFDLVSKIVFLNGSNLDGNATISIGTEPYQVAQTEDSQTPYAANNLVFKKNTTSTGKITGLLTVTGGYTNLWYETATVSIDNEFDLRGGTLVFKPWEDIDTALNDPTIQASSIVTSSGYTITLDTSDSAIRKTNNKATGEEDPNGAARSKVDISSGNLEFHGFNQIIFNNGNSIGTGTLKITPQYEKNPNYEIDSDGNPIDPGISPVITRRDGSVKFFIDGTLPTNSVIIQGNIDAERGSIIFQHQDVSSLTGSNPFAPTVIIRGGGATLAVTEPQLTYKVDGNIKVKDGGFSTFWSDEKGFTAKIEFTPSHQLTLEGGLIGKNDMWINDTNGSTFDAVIANRGVSHLVFDHNLTLSGMNYDSPTDPSAPNPLANAKNAIRTSQGLQLLVKGTTTIKGDISVVGNGKNLLIFEGNTNFASNGSSEAPSIKLDNNGVGYRRNAYNTLVFKGTTNSLALKDIYLKGDWAGNSPDYQLNILSFNNGTTTLNASGGISSVFGNNIVGKNLYSTNYMEHNEALFFLRESDNYLIKQNDFDTEFMKNDYKASGTYTFAGSITADQNGRNYINVENLKADGISLAYYTAANFINATKLELTGDITISGNSANTINISGSSGNTIQNVTASSGSNIITAVQLSAQDITASGGRNTIALSGSSNNSMSDIIANNGTNAIKAKQLNITGAIVSNTGSRSVNQISTIDGSDSLDLAVGGGIFAHWGSSSNEINLGAGTLTLSGGGIMSKDGSNTITAGTLAITASNQTQAGISTNNHGIYNNGGTNTIIADTITIAAGTENACGIFSHSGTNNITTTTITFNSKNAISTSDNRTTNLTIKDGGILHAAARYNTGSSYGLITTSGTLNVNFQGDATLKARFDNGGGTNNFNLGTQGEESTGVKTVTFNVEKLGNNGKKTNFNFNQNQRTLIFKNESDTYANINNNAGGSGQALSFNFNADAGTFDLGTSNLIASTGSTKINLNQEGSTNTIEITKISTTGANTSINFKANNTTLKLGNTGDKLLETTGGTTTISFAQEQGFYTLAGSKITTSNSGTTVIDFVLDGITFNLKDNGSGQFETTGGTSTISFTEGITGTFNGAINATGGNATINIGDGANGIFTQSVGGTAQNVTFQAKQNPSSRTDALGGTLTLKGTANSFDIISADGAYGLVISEDSTTHTNTINSINVSNSGKVAFYNGASTITSTTGNGTLELTTKTETINTNVTLSNAGSGLNVLFTGGTSDQRYRSTLEITGNNNTLASVTSNATNAVIKLDGNTNATAVNITDAITITDGNSLIFSLTSGTNGSNTAIATANGGITVQSGGTLGIAIGAGSDEKKLLVGSGGNVDFKDGSTLQVDFLSGANGVVTLGGNTSTPIEIGQNRKSIINFHDNNSNGAKLAGGLVINGGDNTVNFLGSATLSSVTFTSGKNTINVYDEKTGTIELDGSGAGSQLDNMTNTINLKNDATLDVKNNGGVSGSGTLTASNTNKPSTLNFIGNGAKFDGSLNATGGKAIINVGEAPITQAGRVDTLSVVSGTITGQVTNADLAFNAGKSTLALQGATNTFKSLTSGATNGILVLNATNNAVSAQVNGNILIGTGTSLTFDLTSGNSYNAIVTVNGNITVKNGGTLGIAIGGNGTGTRSVTMTGGVPTLEQGSTLRVDFLKDASGSATLGSGNNGFEIAEGRNSEINFYGGSGTPSLTGGITLNEGTNTANFYGDATLSGITLTKGNNYINVKVNAENPNNGVTATVDTSTISSNDELKNYIDLANKATIDLQNSTGGGTGFITAAVTVSGSETKILGSLKEGSSITFKEATADLTLQGDNTITTLTGYSTTQTYIRHGRVFTHSISNTLILDGSKASSAGIAQAVTSNTVGLKFGSGSKAKTFTFSAEGNTISNVSFVSGSTNNTLAFTNGSNTISQAIEIGSGNDLTIALGSATTREGEPTPSPVSLALTAGLSDASGTAGIEVVGDSMISGGYINISALNYSATSATFAVQNSSATFGTLTANSASTLSLDGSTNPVGVVVTKLNSDNLTANFAGQGENNSATLAISAGASGAKTITLAGVGVAEGSTYNTLDLSALSQTTVSSDTGIQVIGSEQASTDLTIKLKDTKLVLTNGMTTTNATTTIQVENTTGVGAELSGGNIQVTNLNMTGTGDLKTTLSATDTRISTLTAQEGTSNKLIVTDSAKGTIGSIVGETLEVQLNGNNNGSTLAINGEGGTIKSISANAGTANTLSLQSGKLVVTDVINKSLVATGTGLNLEFASNSELSVADGIDATGGGAVNISVKGPTTPSSRESTEEGGEEVTPQPIPTQGIISGGNIKIATLSFKDNTTLQVRNAEATFATVSGIGILSLDGENSTSGVKATINGAIANDANNAITANFNGQNTRGNELILNEDSTLKTITFGTSSINNKISVASGKSLTLADQVTVNSDAAIDFALSNNSTLDFKQGISSEGTSTITVDASGGVNHAILASTRKTQRTSNETVESADTNIQVTNLNLIGDATSSHSAKLTITASNATIEKVAAQGVSTTLALDATNNAVLTTLKAISGKTLALNLNGTNNEARLALRGKSNTIKTLNVTGTNNVLDLSNSSISITDQVSITADQALSVDLVTGRYVATTSQTEVQNGGILNFNFLSGLSEVSGAGVEVKNGGTLNLNVGEKGASGAKALIGSLSNAGTVNLAFKGDADTFFFDPTNPDSSTLALTTIKSEGNNNTVDIASNRFGTDFDVNYTRKDFRVLKVDNGNDTGISGKSLSFKVFVDKTQSGGLTIGGEDIQADGATNYGHAYSDRIVLNTSVATPTTHNLLIIPKIDQLGQITYKSGGTETEGNVAVATVKKNSGISLTTEKVVSGFEVIQAQLVAVDTDITGNSTAPSDYTTYFLGEVKSIGATVEMQEVVSTALSINYDLYMANLNSLNKRMGELRDNPYNQGVWARIFGGSQESDFGIGSETDYVTFQTGYDYDFTLGNAKNYVGIAFSYATSTSKSFNAIQSITNANASSSNVVGIDNIKSGAYEVAVYNSYVADSGWYNDSIAKFSYIDSTFNLTGSSNESQTTNMAFTLSNEVGYRYRFAENEKGSWYIDPQLELALGYLNQSDFNSKIASSAASSGYSTLDAYQDAVMTLRSRIGASLGKKFNTTNGFASVYVGAFYEYDYLEGGTSSIGVGSGASNNLTPLSSNGRAVLNIGSNIALNENARLYIDVEKSFGDQFKTNMQFNFGARYSFGEKSPTISHQESQKRSVAPLKIEESKENSQETLTNTQEAPQRTEQEAKQ